MLAALALAACGHGGGAESPAAAAPAGTVLDAPAGWLSSPVWLADGYIYLLHGDPGYGPDTQLWRTREGGKAERLNPPAEAGCEHTDYRNLQALPDGRLGLGRWCGMEDPRKDHFDLIALDPSTGKVEELAVLGGTPAGNVAWAPGLQTGYVAHSTAICAGIAGLSRDGAQRMPEPVTFDGHTWAVDFTWFRDAAAECTADGRADTPMLRKDGKSLVLFASPTSQGKSGNDRTGQPWNLYRWTPGAGQPSAVVTGLGDPLGAWLDPDDRSVLVSARWQSKYGIWRVDLASGAVTEVSPGRSIGVTMSPDGGKIAAVFQPAKGADYDIDHNELRVIDAK
ncbi:hypothetical protein Cs7R123_28060 [Catellatospora sp. TT07R-123]|nr:hypothetical protein Cs7R123_28060 [Catellatospora sp. TT07R-123]